MKTTTTIFLSLLSLNALANDSSYKQANHKLREILNLNESSEEVHFTGKNCQLKILSKIEHHQDVKGEWNTEDLEASISSNGKTYKFIGAFDAWKSDFKNKANQFTVSETILYPVPENYYDRGLITKQELEKINSKKYSGSPEGRMAGAILQVGMDALTFNIFSEKLVQKMQVEYENLNLKSVQLNIEGKKITCSDLKQN